jgi:hypothetical protein
MPKKSLIRWAGLAAAASGAFFVIAEILFALSGDVPTRVAATSSTWLVAILLGLAASYLGLLALTGLFARQAAESGQLGVVAFVVASLGTVLNSGYYWAGAFVVPHLSELAPGFLDMVDTEPSGLVAAGLMSTFLLNGLGWTLMGIATTRANVLPKPAAWLLTAGAILELGAGIVGLPFGSVVLGVALAWLGLWLWSDKESMTI